MTPQDAQSLQEQHAALYRACISEAASEGRSLMGRLVEHARHSLHQRSGTINDAQESAALTEALRQLNKHESQLCQRYPAALLEAFSEAVSGEKARPTALSALSFDQLELMDEAQVQESVELARAQQQTLLAVEAPLSDLNALMSGVQGLKTVQPDRNPLRPEVYVRTLRGVLREADAAAAVQLRWMQHLGAALGQELGQVYSGLCALLRSHGVAGAAYTVTQVAPAGAAAPRPAASAGPAAAPAAGGGVAPANAAPGGETAAHTRAEVLLTVDQLRRLLSGELDGPADSFADRFSREFEAGGRAPLRPEFSQTVPAAFEALQEMKQVDQVMQRLADRNQATPTGQPRREAPPSGARSLGQSLGREVVNLMVDNIARDSRLLAPVQQAVLQLEPALLRLALQDPRFFSDKQHPARRLLEQMTQRSLAWESADAPGFEAFMKPLHQAVEMLQSVPLEGAEPFDIALKALEEAWGEQQKRERRHKDQAMQALLHAEQRNLIAEKIVADVRTRPETLLAPAQVAAFLCGPWAQVMAEARLADAGGGADPGGYEAVTQDLLWSARPELARTHLARLTQLIPSLLARLRAGLRSIDYPAAQAEAFFDDLMALHQQALKPPGATAAPVPPSARAQLEAQFREAEESEPWLAPSEAQHSGFMPTQDAPPAFQDTQPLFADTAPQRDRPRRAMAGRAAEAGVPLGAWVELQLHGRWVRHQLTWASPHGSLFMFTSAGGGTQSMTRRMLDTLLDGGGLRVISDQALVDGALDAVARAALRNSLDIAL
jgi:hypothetical protein